MSSACGCGAGEVSTGLPDTDRFTVYTLGAASALALNATLGTYAKNAESPKGLAQLFASGAPEIEYHLVPGADGALASISHAGDNEFSTILTGSIAGIPFQLELTGKLDLRAGTLTIGLTLLKPIKTTTYTWTFKLGSLRVLQNGAYFASGVTLDEANSSDFSALGLNWLCILKCGGTTILGILVKCLPSLAGGPSAFIACVTAQAGAAAAGIAACIAGKCI